MITWKKIFKICTSICILKPHSLHSCDFFFPHQDICLRCQQQMTINCKSLLAFIFCFSPLPFTSVDILQINFFHKVGSMDAPVTDSEKLIWSVLEAERPSIRLSNVIVIIYFILSFKGLICTIILIYLWSTLNLTVSSFMQSIAWEISARGKQLLPWKP